MTTVEKCSVVLEYIAARAPYVPERRTRERMYQLRDRLVATIESARIDDELLAIVEGRKAE